MSLNKTEIEVMFVGDVAPNFNLPPGMKYIYSKVKPSQCYYIGATRVDGNYLVEMADDVKISPGTLDNCLNMLKSYDESKTIVTPRYRLYPMDFYGDNTYLEIVPCLSIGGIINRDLWNKLGIDRNFVCSYFDCDQSMKVWSMGGKIAICESGRLIDVQISYSRVNTQVSYSRANTRIANWDNGYDRRLFYSLWTHCPMSEDLYPTARTKQLYPPVLKRQKESELIVDSPDILTVSQGPKGIWL
jgi:hypothetical protein